MALLVAVFLSMVDYSLPARILAIYPFSGKSHFIFLSSVMKTLVQNGHEVVEYSPFPPSKPVQNYSHVEIHSGFENFFNSLTYDDFVNLAGGSTNIFRVLRIFFLSHGVCEDTFKNEKIKKLLKSDQHFDLVFTESPFWQESMVVFGQRFKAPVISLQTYAPTSTLNMDAGNALSLATITGRQYALTDQMSFTERTINFVTILVRLSFYYLYHLPKHDELIRKYYSEDVPPLVDIVRNISLYLVNAHPNVGYVQPYTPNIIPIAGINIASETTPLPQEIQKFMDEAKDGVVYFSFGSVFPTHTMPKKELQAFVNVFSKLKQRVIWRMDAESLPELSENVKLVKWVPQPSVLAHPNCVLLITHGGFFSQLEALHAGIPTVGIPFIVDQPFNIKFSEHRGFGVKLDFNNLSEETVGAAINTVLYNPKYRESAQLQSKLFRDRPLSPADSVIFWVEYVLRHGGAHHLRSSATLLSWYQLAMLDVLAVVVLVLTVILLLMYFAIKTICSPLTKRNPVSKSKKKK